MDADGIFLRVEKPRCENLKLGLGIESWVFWRPYFRVYGLFGGNLAYFNFKRVDSPEKKQVSVCIT